MNDFLDSLDVARLARVSIDTIRRWRAEGRFPPPTHKDGRRRYWQRDDVERALASIRDSKPTPITN